MNKIFNKTNLIVFALMVIFLLLSINNIFSAKSDAEKNNKKIMSTVIQNIENSLELASESYEYTDITTRHESWAVLSQQILVGFKGEIKAACKFHDIKIDNKKVKVILSKPYVKINRINEQYEVDTVSNIGFSTYNTLQDDKIQNEETIKIADRIKGDLFSQAELNSKKIVYNLLNNLGILVEDIEIVFK